MAFEVSTKRDRFIIESDADSSKVLEIEFCELSSNPELKKMEQVKDAIKSRVSSKFNIEKDEVHLNCQRDAKAAITRIAFQHLK